MTAAILASDLGKSYRVRHRGQQAKYRTLRESLVDLARAPARRLLGHSDGPSEEFWALRGVNFRIQPGEVVGIIGHNGAGKSTLLKTLSRITRPTTGRVELHGRVGSLLEVGTGFHPELTGRENVFLNGSILGMTRREIARRFDEIVAFSEIERFLDTPVKRYSSGMYVRLAFAVAAHLETEILLVDEILAVGDATFQKKCMGKMSDLGREGRTIVFISHNMNAIAKLTGRSILLERGCVVAEGATSEVIRHYLAMGGKLEPEWRRRTPIDREAEVTLTSIRVCDEDGEVASRFSSDRPFFIDIGFAVTKDAEAQIAFRLNSNVDCTTIFTSALSDLDMEKSTRFGPGRYMGRCVIPAHCLGPGSYHLLVAANNPRGPQFDLIEQVLEFEVTDVGSLVTLDDRLGVITPKLHWDLSRDPSGPREFSGSRRAGSSSVFSAD